MYIICIYATWISAFVFCSLEFSRSSSMDSSQSWIETYGIESDLIPVMTFVPRELFLHYTSVCEMRTVA